MNFLAVGMGGALGAISRYAVALALGGRGLYGALGATLSVNVLGCLAIGALTAAFGRVPASYSPWLLFATTGFLGGFTTFSTFGAETVTLLQKQQLGLAALNAGANLFVSLGAVALGRWLAG